MILNEEDLVKGILPKEGWLHDFVSFTDGLEACPRFRFFSAACVLGAAVNNKLYIHRGDKDLLPKLFPNLWVLLLAPPGRGHKTSTINMAVNCLTQASPEVRILADKLTPESLVKALASPVGRETIRIGPRDATGLIKAPEFSVFFGKQQYNTGLVSLITDLYDWREEWASETIMRGKMILRNNCISVFGGSTPDWLQQMLPQDAFTGGFMARYVIVEMPPSYFKRRAFPKRVSKRSWEDLVHGLSLLGHMSGEAKWTPAGEKFYEKHYESIIPTGDPQKDAYREREAEQVLKLALLLAIATQQLLVDESHMVHARQILDALMGETEGRIERLTTHPRMSLVQDIKEILKTHDQLSRRDLIKKVYRGLERGEQQFMEAIRILLLAEEVEQVGSPGNPSYKLKETEK